MGVPIDRILAHSIGIPFPNSGFQILDSLKIVRVLDLVGVSGNLLLGHAIVRERLPEIKERLHGSLRTQYSVLKFQGSDAKRFAIELETDLIDCCFNPCEW